MQQHLMQMQPMMAGYYPSNVTTDHIQQIVESQNSGKLSECTENQARLQRNLMYLAAIADSQPQPPTMHGQLSPSGTMQPGARYMQHQQAQQMPPHSLMSARSSMLYAQQPFSALQQQALHSQLGMSSGGSTTLHMLQNEACIAGGSGAIGAGGYPDVGCDAGDRGMAGGSKHDIASAGSAEGRGRSSGGQGGDGGETLYLKGADDGN